MISNHEQHHYGKRTAVAMRWGCASALAVITAGCAVPSDSEESAAGVIEPGPAEEAHTPDHASAYDGAFSRADILWRHDDGTLAIWFMNDLTKTDEAYPVWWDGTPPSTDWTIAATGDFNANGARDILWRHDDGTLAIWELSSAGTLYSESYPTFYGAPVGSDWTIRGVGVFGKGFSDDILWRRANGDVSIWYMQNGELLVEAYPGTRTTDWAIQGVADFDGNGVSDILWRRTDGRLDIWFMSYTGEVIATQTPGHPGLDWQVLAARDFNYDGKADILWRNTTGTTAIWLMDGGVNTSQAYPGALSSDWEFQGVGDFNLDGYNDILWRNTSGTLWTWLMNGPSVASQGTPGAAPPAWKVKAVTPIRGNIID